MLPLKKILLIILFGLISIGIAFGIYYLFFRAAPPAEIPEELEEWLPSVGLPPAEVALELSLEEQFPDASRIARGGLTLVRTITEARTLGAELSSDGKNLNYYNPSNGKFYRLTPEGDVTQLSDKTFYQVEDVSWAPDSDKAVLEYPDGANIVYDFKTETQVTLPKHWEDFDFSPDSRQIVAKSLDRDPLNRWLVAVDSNGTNMQTIEMLGNNDKKVQVDYSPNGQVVAFSRTGEPQGFARQEILLIGMHGENFKGLKVDGLNFDSKWSKTGNRLLYNVHNGDTDYKPVLWITDAHGDNIGTNKRNLSLNTWADKCAFANERILYCAVPQTLRRGAGFQPTTADRTPDVFYKIDTTTGIKTLIATPHRSFTAENLMVSDDEENLFFTNKLTGTIEKIGLK